MDELLELEVEPRGEVVVARLTGELDVSTAASLAERLEQAVPSAAKGLVVDFTGLDFIDSSGIAMLFALARRLGSRRQELRVVSQEGRPVRRVLDLVEFGRAAPLSEDVEAAVADIEA